MEKLLLDLEALGVHIPKNLSDEQLLRHAKQLNPNIVTVEPVPGNDKLYRAYTRKDLTGDVFSDKSPAVAALTLLLEQLKAGRYSVYDTTYKLSAAQRRN